MKARKSSPKSIRFNIKDFELGMSKGGFESAQEMVDFLLKNYINEENVQFIKQKTGQIDVQKSVQAVTNIKKSVTDVPDKEDLSKADMWKLIREGKV